MSGHVVVGVDPGGTSAWAACSMGRIVEHAQGPMVSNAQSLVRFMRAHKDSIVAVGIEDQYISSGKPDSEGKVRGNMHSSKVIAKRAGIVHGFIMCAGFTDVMERVWEPLPSVWRAQFGLNAGKKRGPIDVQTRLYAGHRLGVKLDEKMEHTAVACCIAWALWENWARQNSSRPWIVENGK